VRGNHYRLAIFIGLAAASAGTWWLLGRWVAGTSERFYLLAPLWGVALCCRGRRRRVSLSRLRSGLWAVAGLGVLCAAYNLWLTATLDGGHSPAWGLRPAEILLAVYFVLAIGLLLLGVRAWLRPLLVYLVDLAGRAVLGHRRVASTSRYSRWLPDALLMLPVAPLLVGPFHIHRFKVPNPQWPAELAGRPFEDIRFQTSDGLSLCGWFIPGLHSSSRTLVMCHGMGTNRTAMLPYLAIGDALEANMLLFDFRGHGDSDGHTVSFGYRERLDVLAAVDYLRRCRPASAREIVGLGVSMGAVSLAGAAAEVQPPLGAVILDSGFASAAEMADSAFAWLPGPVRNLVAGPVLPLASLDAGCPLGEVRPEALVGRLRAPVLVIHARDDHLVCATHALRLYARAGEPRSLWIADTGDHGSAIEARADYLIRVARFVNASHRHAPGLQMARRKD
jgi:fermentation-respiration switch protein FrsA (DUF1100 family)